MSLEGGRLVAGAVVDELGARTVGGGSPFASAIVAGHHHKHIRTGWGELRPRREAGVIGSDKRQGGQRLDGGEWLSWRGMLERRHSRDALLGHCKYGLAVAPIEDEVLPRLAAVAKRLLVALIVIVPITVPVQREKDGRLRAVVVPNVVMHRLKVPAMTSSE